MTSVKSLLQDAERLLSKYSQLEEIRGVQEEEQFAMEQFHRFQNLSNNHLENIDEDFLRVYNEAIENGLPEDHDLQACREEIVAFLENTRNKYADLIDRRDRNEEEQSLFEIIADLKEIKRQSDY
jgi:hypothetical protein